MWTKKKSEKENFANTFRTQRPSIVKQLVGDDALNCYKTAQSLRNQKEALLSSGAVSSTRLGSTVAGGMHANSTKEIKNYYENE